MGNRADTFNRTPSSSSIQSPSDGGSNWETNGTTWGISASGTGDGNGGYRVSGSGVAYLSLEASASNVEVSMTPRLAMGQGGPVGRFADTSNAVFAWWTSSNLRLYKLVAGTLTQLGSTYTATISTGDVVMLRATSADALSVLLNGTVRVGPVTDAAGSSNTKCGYRQNLGASTTMFDDFVVTDLDAGGGSAAVFYYHQQMQSQ